MNARSFSVARVQGVLDPGDKRHDVPKLVQRCNQLLRTGLGTLGSFPCDVVPSSPKKWIKLVGSEVPHYEWIWSENLTRRVRDSKNPNDFSSFTYERNEDGLYVPQRDWFLARGTAVRNHWIVVKNCVATEDENLWYSTFGEFVMYPGRIFQQPVGTPEGVLRVLEPRQLPWEEFTREIVSIIRKDREMMKLSEAGLLALAEEQMKQVECQEEKNAVQALMPLLDAMSPARDAVTWRQPGRKEFKDAS